MTSAYMKLVVICTLLAIALASTADQVGLRGIPTSYLSKYAPSKPFACLDGSATIPFEFVNDDYCDCRDGSDEPGTSACPNGRFFCENKGHVGTIIPSHFVGDGVCDCCDGTDEYETKVVCNNTCFELAQKTQAERDARRALHAAGVAKKLEIIRESVGVKADRQARLGELEANLQKVEGELKEKEALKEKAEAPENEAKDKHQKLWEEQRAVREALARDNQMRDMFADLDANNDSRVSIDELQKHSELDTDSENEFTAEEVRSILGADSVDFNEFNVTVFEQISNLYQKLPPPTVEPPVEVPTTTHAAPIDDSEEPLPHDGEDDSEHDYEDHEPPSHVPTSLEHEKHLHDDAMPEYDDETKHLIQAADHARNEYNEVERRTQDLRREIDDLKRQSDVDIGVQGEYAAFIDQCYDYEEREYTYRVCMFKDARQIPKGGGGDVTIGYWDAWVGPENNKHLKMRYSNGATCWNGPARSLTLTFRCGIEHKVVDVREPTRCEYTMIFETPSACDEKVASGTGHQNHEEF